MQFNQNLKKQPHHVKIYEEHNQTTENAPQGYHIN